MRGTSLPTRDLTPARPREHSSGLSDDQTGRDALIRAPLPSIVPAQPPPRLWLPSGMWLATPDDLWAIALEDLLADGELRNYQTLLVVRAHATGREHAEATRTSFGFVRADGRIDLGEDFRAPQYPYYGVRASGLLYIAPYRSCDLVDLEPIQLCSECLETACLGCNHAHTRACSRRKAAKPAPVSRPSARRQRR